MKHGASGTVEPTVAEDLEIRVPHGLKPSEATLYRLLAGNGYRVLRHGWPDYFVVPGDGSPGFAVEVKAGYNQVRPDESAGVAAWAHRPRGSATP